MHWSDSNTWKMHIIYTYMCMCISAALIHTWYINKYNNNQDIFPIHLYLKCLPTYMEKAMAPHSSTLAWKMPWTEEPDRLQSWDHTESDTTERLHFHFSLSCIGEGNGNPLHCSCPENPRDGGAWWAAISGVAQSQTWLKQLSSSSSLPVYFLHDLQHFCGKGVCVTQWSY